MNKTHLTISIIVVSILVLLVWFYNPKAICQRRLHFTLPESAKIVKHSYGLPSKKIYAKISFDSNDYYIIEKGLNDNFIKLDLSKDITITNFWSFASWWDMKEEEIETAYKSFKSGRRHNTISLFVFITQNNQGQYFLYLVV